MRAFILSYVQGVLPGSVIYTPSSLIDISLPTGQLNVMYHSTSAFHKGQNGLFFWQPHFFLSPAAAVRAKTSELVGGRKYHANVVPTHHLFEVMRPYVFKSEFLADAFSLWIGQCSCCALA